MDEGQIAVVGTGNALGVVDPGVPGLSGFVRVGQGGFGAVFRARQDKFNRDVAVKVLMAGGLDEVVERRLRREQESMGSLSAHPAIVALYDSGLTVNGSPYLLMEYMAGGSLADRIGRDGPLPWQEACEVAVRIAGAVQAAHDVGVLHRDLKPENILLSEYGDAKLTDFGIASLMEGTATATSSVTATIEHCAPEVLDGAPATPAGDVYSLGSTLSALITGLSPFRTSPGDSMLAIMMRVVRDPAPDLAVVGVPVGVAGVVAASLAKDPADRPQTATEFADRLTAAATAAGPVKSPDSSCTRVLRPVDDAPASRPAGQRPGPLTRATPIETPSTEPLPADAVDLAQPAAAGRRRPAVLVAVVALLAFGCIAAIAAVLAMTSGDDGGSELPPPPTQPSVDVPDVVGLSEESARTQVEAAGLTFAIGGHEEADDDRVGEIISQSPVSGKVEEGATISVIVAVDEETALVEVPAIVGLSEESARSQIEAAGLAFDVGGHEQVTGDRVGLVINQAPTSGMLQAGALVSVIIGVETPVEPVPVPNVVGEPAQRAQALIEDVGLAYLNVGTAVVVAGRVGDVVEQSPASGTLEPGQVVSVIIGIPSPAPPPAEASCATYTYNDVPPFGLCDKGDAVAYLQQDLSVLGYVVAVDGYYGVDTESAVRALQADSGFLEVDGRAGPATLEWLWSLFGALD